MKLTITVLAFALYTVGVSAVYAGGCYSGEGKTKQDSVQTEKKSTSS